MYQNDLAILESICDAIDAVTGLSGNCGKKVRRVLEKYFPNGVFDMVLPTPRLSSPFAYACYLREMVDFGCILANEASHDTEAQVHFIVTPAEGWKHYRLRAELSAIPETVKARQKFLWEFEYLLQRIRTGIHLDLRGSAHELFFSKLFEGCLEEDFEENRATCMRQFNALLNRDYREILQIHDAVVSLAGFLDSRVRAALCEAEVGREDELQQIAA